MLNKMIKPDFTLSFERGSDFIKYDRRKKYNFHNKSSFLKDPEDSYAFVCGLDTFSIIYELEKRRLQRNWVSVFFMHLLVDIENCLEDSNYTATKMEKILRSNIRCGDVICNWYNNDYLLLLMNIEDNDVKKVINRIKKCCKNKFINYNRLQISYNYHKL